MARGAIGFVYGLSGALATMAAVATRDEEWTLCIGFYTLSLMAWIFASVFHKETSQ